MGLVVFSCEDTIHTIVYNDHKYTIVHLYLIIIATKIVGYVVMGDDGWI